MQPEYARPVRKRRFCVTKMQKIYQWRISQKGTCDLGNSKMDLLEQPIALTQSRWGIKIPFEIIKEPFLALESKSNVD